jgi:hypothetical protein
LLVKSSKLVYDTYLIASGLGHYNLLVYAFFKNGESSIVKVVLNDVANVVVVLNYAL